MFGKRKNLEDKIDALEVKVKELSNIVSKYCQDVDYLFSLYKAQEDKAKQTPKPRHRPRKSNGKENPKAAE